MQVWFNSSCSKSNLAKQELDAAGKTYVLRNYLEQVPSVPELAELVGRLDAEPWDICRTGEAVAAELGMADWPRTPDSRRLWLQALHDHPVLIQRPIVVSDKRAVVAREPGWLADFEE